MSQESILEVLKINSNNWLTSKELIEKTKTSEQSTRRALKNLRKNNFINFRLNINQAYEYKSKLQD